MSNPELEPNTTAIAPPLPDAPRTGARRGRRLLWIVVPALIVGAGLLARATLLGPSAPGESTRAGGARSDPREEARAIAGRTPAIEAALETGDRTRARALWGDFSDRWLEIEDPIKAADRGAYDRIESSMQDVAAALPAEGEWRATEASAAVTSLSQACLAFATSTPDPRAATPRAVGPTTVAAFLDAVRSAEEATGGGRDPAPLVKALNEKWLDVEPLVAARSKSAYATSEEALAQARASVAREDRPGTARALGRLEAAIGSLGSDRYGVLDAAAILLREGAEALLVLAALVAYLGKLGAPEKTRLVWLGGAAGTVASLVLGLGLARVFEGLVGGMRRELVEGVSSLVAAGLLVIVGQWLHGKIHRGGWKREVAAAVHEGRGLSLAAVAFFAVFREGGETVLFYVGMAPSIDGRSMALGIGLGLALLGVLGWVVLGLGKRVPLGTFFTFATALIWLVAIKFVGGGVHSLQAAGIVGATPIAHVPSIEVLGVSPTLETCLAQVAGVLAWVAASFGPALVRRARSA